MANKRSEPNLQCGRRLAEEIVRSGMTQKEMASKIYCKPQHISNVVNGRRNLTIEIAQKVVDVIEEKTSEKLLVEYLLCLCDTRTVEERIDDAHEKRRKYHVDKHEKLSNLFVDHIGIISGYEFVHLDDCTSLPYITILDKKGKERGAITLDSYNELSREVVHYASYLVQRIVEERMESILCYEKEVPIK